MDSYQDIVEWQKAVDLRREHIKILAHIAKHGAEMGWYDHDIIKRLTAYLRANGLYMQPHFVGWGNIIVRFRK